jgi:enolase
MPVPMMNIINGAKHAGNALAIQEFHIMPVGFDGFLEALRAGVEIYHILKKVLVKRYGMAAKNIGDEGGFAPPMTASREAFDAILDSIEEAGYTPGKEVALAIDAAASEFYSDDKYSIDGHHLTPAELCDYYERLCEEYPLVSIEDPFGENDFGSFSTLTKKIGEQVQVVGDDLFVSNPERIQRGIDIGAGNALLLKVNQIGTLTEALQAADLAAAHKYGVVVSHRSGETEDTFIADLVVALSCGQIKTGAPARSDRTAKYNRLIEIQSELESKAKFASASFRFPKTR